MLHSSSFVQLFPMSLCIQGKFQSKKKHRVKTQSDMSAGGSELLAGRTPTSHPPHNDSQVAAGAGEEVNSTHPCPDLLLDTSPLSLLESSPCLNLLII